MFDAPSVGLYVPAGHASKVMVAESAPTLAQNPPIGHGVHSVAFATALNEPDGHGVQASEPGRAAKEPGVQGKHMTLASNGE